MIIGDGRLKRRGEGGELFPSCLFPARSRWISSLRRRAGEYRVKYFLFLPKMFSHFWVENKKVLGRKWSRFCLRKSRILGRIFVASPLGWKSRCLLMEGLFGNGKGERGERGVLFPLLEIGIVHHDGVVLGDKFGCFLFCYFVSYLTPNLIVACIASPPLLAYTGVCLKHLVLPRDRGITREGAMQEFLVKPKV